MKKLYTTEEAADVLTISPATLSNKISDGEVTVVKIFNTTRIAEEELERIIEEGVKTGEAKRKERLKVLSARKENNIK